MKLGWMVRDDSVGMKSDKLLPFCPAARPRVFRSPLPMNIPPCPLLRLEGVIRGREKFQANSHAGGLTNAEKERKKNYLMIRKGKTVKHKTRMGEKQVGCTK